MQKKNQESNLDLSLTQKIFLRCFYHYAEILFLSEEEKHAKEIFLKSYSSVRLERRNREQKREEGEEKKKKEKKENGWKVKLEKKLVSNMFLFDEGGESNVEFLISKLGKSAHDSTHRRVKNMYLHLREFISRIFLPTDLHISSSKYLFVERCIR